MTQVIVDTGPLVAFLSENDSARAWANTVFAELEPPFLTCDVVIAETYHLLTQTRSGADGLMALLETGALRLIPLAELDPASLRKLILRYANVPMDLADACIVRLSELHPEAEVVTIDTDFRIYRRNGRQAIPLLMPTPK
ncbi:MAG: PIN domain-containing protein [Opitutaceae bacterium]|nr:PIN domain-containing protein [Opitutaceae bacterium]